MIFCVAAVIPSFKAYFVLKLFGLCYKVLFLLKLIPIFWAFRTLFEAFWTL